MKNLGGKEPEVLAVDSESWVGVEVHPENDGIMTSREAFCASATEKRAELNIRALKYGADKDAGHTNGRWYARSEAYGEERVSVDE